MPEHIHYSCNKIRFTADGGLVHIIFHALQKKSKEDKSGDLVIKHNDFAGSWSSVMLKSFILVDRRMNSSQKSW
ncbi:hypothetical protein TNCV_2318331 [Trichonephila clavipes]|nr:hypothetical protein TNCV_2318331 [Trichonephila clavipes]